MSVAVSAAANPRKSSLTHHSCPDFWLVLRREAGFCQVACGFFKTGQSKSEYRAPNPGSCAPGLTFILAESWSDDKDSDVKKT